MSRAETMTGLLLQLEAPPVDHAEYHAYRTATDLREPYRSADTYTSKLGQCC